MSLLTSKNTVIYRNRGICLVGVFSVLESNIFFSV